MGNYPHIGDEGTSCSSGCHDIGISNRILMSMTRSYNLLSVSFPGDFGVVDGDDAIASLRFGIFGSEELKQKS